MKALILIILSILVGSFSFGQAQFTYTQDSSTLSVVFNGDTKIDSAHTGYTLNLKGKWNYKKQDSVNVNIRGIFMSNSTPLEQIKPIDIIVIVFGKTYSRKMRPGNFTLSYKAPIKSIYKSPKIVVLAKVLNKRKKQFIELDTIDIATIWPNTKQ